MGAAVVTTAALVLGLTDGGEAGEPATVEVIDARVTDGRLAVAMTVENHDNRHQDVEISLTLGVFGDNDAWSRRVAEVAPREAAIRSGDSALVVWDEPIALPTGSYELTAWVKTEEPNDIVIQHTAPFTVLAESDQIARVKAPAGDSAFIIEPGITVEGGEFVHVYGDVLVEAPRAPTSVRIDLLPLGQGGPWWVHDAVKTLTTENVRRADTWSLPVDLMTALPPGEYGVRMALLTGGEANDNILLPITVTVDPPAETIRRGVPVSGPLAIVDAVVEASGDEGLVVTATVQNLHTGPVDGVFWWLLGTPGDPEPWRFPDGTSFRVGRRLEAGERRDIRLVLDGDLPVGIGFELSVWAHTTVPDSEETLHSDGIRATQMIDTAAPAPADENEQPAGPADTADDEPNAENGA